MNDYPSIVKAFLELYGGSAEDVRVFTAPGRVNLIGEHTDYNGGFVFPAAICYASTIAVRRRKDGSRTIRLAATDLPDRVTVDLDNPEASRSLRWGNYQAGVVDVMQKAGYTVSPCDVLYCDEVPLGAGLSSSAAIEVVMALMLATFSLEDAGLSQPVDMIEIAGRKRILRRQMWDYGSVCQCHGTAESCYFSGLQVAGFPLCSVGVAWI